jgi:hypothetical protein
MIVWPAKDPAEQLDYSWTPPLDDGDAIATFTATITSGSAIKDSDSATDSIATVWISGGTADEKTYFNLVAMTDGGRTFREVAMLPVIDRASELIGEFRIRCPMFAAIDDGVVSYWLAEAASVVGSSWPADAVLPAKALYAAHMMQASGLLASAIPAGVTSFKSGTFSATVSDSLASLTGLDATPHGREFAVMRRRYFAGPRLAWTPPADIYNVL